MVECPAYSTDTNVRWDEWERQIDGFLGGEALGRLFALYGFQLGGNDMRDHLANAVTFAREHWDYRSLQRTTERWEVADYDPIVTEHRDEIAACAKELGMLSEPTDSIIWSDDADVEWILVLGGARTANLDRTMTASEIRNGCRVTPPAIGLTALRMLGQVELDYVASLVPHAEVGKTTEYDVMRAAFHKVFGGHDDGVPYVDVAKQVPGNSDWAVHRHDARTFTIAAPSSDPTRRANTLDTLVFFDRLFSPAPRSRIVCVTSPLYVGYQTAVLVPLAISRGWEMRLIGSRVDERIPFVTTNILQEVKGTLDAMEKSLAQRL